MIKKIQPNLINKKSILDLPFFKDQISFHTKVKSEEFKPTNIDSELSKGLFQNKTTQQLHDVYEQLSNNGKKNVILELPLYAGKTLVSFTLAYHYAHNLGKNAVIIYPSAIQRDIAFEFHKKHLAEKYFSKFPNFLLISNEEDLKTDFLYAPQIYITDIYSIQKFFIHTICEEIFWEQFQLCVLEDCNNYSEAFGSNCAYVIRRLLSKLDHYNQDYQLLCTTKPINNRMEFISMLTGVKEFGEVANIDSAFVPEFEVFNWYPPINHLNYDSSGVIVTRENFFNELKNLIQSLLETNSKESYTAVLWEKYFISADDIATFTRKFVKKEEFINKLVIGNNLNEVRLSLLKQGNKLDLSDLRSIVIVGNKKPLRFYLTDLMHIGLNPKQIYFFDTQSPSLQYQIMEYLRNPKEIVQLTQTEKLPTLDLNDTTIINQHWSFLKDEQPRLSSGLLNKYFPEKFISTIAQNNLSQKGNFLILNKDLKFFPREKRTDEQLHFSSKNTFFNMILVEGGDRTNVGKMVDYEVRTKCYPNNILVLNKQKYFIKNIDWNNKIVNLEYHSGEPQLVYKVSNYFGFTFDEGYTPTTVTRLNNRVYLIRGNAQISEQILNLKTTQNFENYSTAGIPDNNSFENVRLNYIEFRFPIQLFERFYPPEENPPINQEEEDEQEQLEQNNEINEEQRRNHIYEALFPILHTFGHLLIESIRVNNVLSLDEIKLYIPSLDQLLITGQIEDENEHAQTEWLYCSVYLIDLTNRNLDILDSLYHNDVTSLLKIMEDILLQCPCEIGSNTCIKVDYCNIENCGITNQPNLVINQDNSITDTLNRLNKINTLRFICELLDKGEQKINNFVRWKRSLPERNLTSCIYENDKLKEMVNIAKDIFTSKGIISLKNYYRSRFFTAQEVNESTALGVTNPTTKDIAFRPGLTENELFETIFHEYFHNYEFDNYRPNSPQNNINQQLSFFDWDEIDNPKNIPYVGLLVVEGAAVWFSLRMMEIFSDFSYLRLITDPSTRFMEYRAGLQLLLEVERKTGYKNVFELLKKSFKVSDYENAFINVVNDETGRYLSNSAQQRLWCLDIKHQLTNINRITYFLRILVEPTRNHMGLQEMRTKQDKRVIHISAEEILRYANMTTEQFVQDAQVTSILNKHGLTTMQWDGNNGFICEGCATNCNLFTACMLNGGRNIFREILLIKFPPPQHNSKPSLLRRIFRRN